MASINDSDTQANDLEDFLKNVLGPEPGWMCVFSGQRASGSDKLLFTKNKFFLYPEALAQAVRYIKHEDECGREVYFCAHLLKSKNSRKKENAASNIWTLYSDLDRPDVPDGAPEASILVESSPGKLQGYWQLTRPVSPQKAEELNKRLALVTGADKSGADISQVLRPPGTHHKKTDAWSVVHVVENSGRKYDPDELDRVLPPLQEEQRAKANLDDSEPPVPLVGEALEWWQGKKRVLKANKTDTSKTLFVIAEKLADAGASAAMIRVSLAERDLVLGFHKYLDRPGEYGSIAHKMLGSRFASKGETNNRAFKLTPMADFLAEPEEEVPYVWDDTLPAGGLSILGARPKTGKTTLARNLAHRVARGTPFLGRDTRQGPVVYLALEEKRAELQRQLRQMGVEADDPLYVHTGAAPQDALMALRAAIRQVRPLLAVVDPLQDFARVRDMNDYSAVHESLAPLREVARETGTHVLVLHHNNKSDDLLGSTQLSGAVDTLLFMARRDGARTIRSVQRYGTDISETLLRLNRNTGVVVEDGDYSQHREDDLKEVILNCVQQGALTETEIRRKVGGNENAVAKTMRVLVEEGQLVRTGAGKKGDPYRYEAAK